MGNNKHNYFFEAYKTNNVKFISEASSEFVDEEHIGIVKYRLDNNLEYKIGLSSKDTVFTCEFVNDNNVFKYGYNIKKELNELYPEIIRELQVQTGKDILNDDNIGVRLVSSYVYRMYDEQYDNECRFVEYIMSEKAYEDKQTPITEEILKNAGFEDITKDFERDYYKKELDIDNYSCWRVFTNDNDGDVSFIKLDISNDLTNRGTKWHLHIDNDVCETIGSADIDTVWEFNTLMEVFGSKFRL